MIRQVERRIPRIIPRSELERMLELLREDPIADHYRRVQILRRIRPQRTRILVPCAPDPQGDQRDDGTAYEVAVRRCCKAFRVSGRLGTMFSFGRCHRPPSLKPAASRTITFS